MPHPFLPKRKTGTDDRFPVPNGPGIWEERPQTHLEQLAAAIEIPPTKSRIYSVPDPWARAILFDRALFDESHPLHKTTRGEWRGLLALIGLKERRNFGDMSVSKVDLRLLGQSRGTFASVLSRLSPQDHGRLAADSDWQQFYLMRWKLNDHSRPRAFGITSPFTLVCAAADYIGALSQEIPWYNGKVLEDPQEHLSKRERFALAEWLRVIIQQIPSGPDSSRRGWVIEHLREFAASLANVPEPNALDVLSDRSLGFTHGIYRVLDRPRKKETGTVTDVSIATSVNGALTYLLIDPSLEHQINEPAREIVIYGDISLANASHFTRTGKYSDSVTPGIFWCTPDFFFSETLIYDNNGTPAFPGALPIKSNGDPRKKSIVLPISAEALKLFQPRTLAENFTVDWQSDGTAVCRLRMSLRSSLGVERTCMIQKTYTDDSMVRIKDLPMVAIWPNFRMASWKTYFTFETWQGGEQDELKVRPWSAAEPEPFAHRPLNLSRRFQVYLNKVHPEVMICETPYYDKQRQREWTAKGMLLLDLPPEIAPTEQARVLLGIDFGSTGSNVYHCTEHGTPAPLEFQNRLRQLTAFAAADFKDFSRDFFVPNQTWTSHSVLSVFHDFGDPPKGENDRMILRDGHLFYLDDPRGIAPGERVRLRSNLKWGGERERLVAKDFLKQLCLQAAAELAEQGVREVDLRYSYPTAFSKADTQNYKVNWKPIPKAIQEMTGVAFAHNPSVDAREAMAATRYFAENTGGGDITGGAITVDIGGGTTDLAVWRNLDRYANSSILFAGRDILLAPLSKRPEVLGEIEPSAAGATVGQAAFSTHLDAIIASVGKRLIEALPVKEARPNVRGLLRLIEIGLCGVGFYAGLMIRRLTEKQSFEKSAFTSMSIFVGGNGSKLLDWCALGDFSDQSPIHDKFSDAFRAGAELKDLSVTIVQSRRPKAEVAWGLVSQPLQLHVFDDEPVTMAGERFHIGNNDEGKRSWIESPTWQDMETRQLGVDRSLPLFHQFLESIELSADQPKLDKIGGAIDLRLRKQASDIQDTINKDSSLRGKGQDLLRNEPIFIMGLKKFLELETEEWVSRA